MLITYRFSINGHSVEPVYKDGLSKEFALEPSQRFYRATLDGTLKFENADFDWLKAQFFGTEFKLLIEKGVGGTWSDYWRGTFSKTDGDWNDDDRTVSVKVDPDDEYVDILAGLENEYNLIKLAPALTPLAIQKRPLLQYYLEGDDVVGCFLAGNYWEQGATPPTDPADLGNLYKFGTAGLFYEITLSGPDTPLTGAYVGNYVAATPTDLVGPTGAYLLRPNDHGLGTGETKLDLVRVSDGAVLYISNAFFIGVDQDLTFYEEGGSRELTGYRRTINHRARILLDTDTYDGDATFDLLDSDMVGENRNYKKVAPFGSEADEKLLVISSRVRDEPTEYGRNDEGKYFMPPTDGRKYYPVARNAWGNAGFWLDSALWDWGLEDEARKEYTLKETNPIESVISVLLAEIVPGVTHEGDAAHSEFLYGSANPVAGQAFKLFMAQKSNVLQGEFDTPAQKAPIKLGEVFRMLRDVFQCYWHIDAGKLRVEHISWYKNGGTYAYSPIYTADLTTLSDVRNRKTWGYAANKYTYDKEALAESIKLSWMDEVTAGFEGVPIKIKSSFVKKDKKDEINVGSFTSDIDYMLLNPSAISMDGFALFGAVLDGGVYKTPLVPLEVDGVDELLQNGFLSWPYLASNFWTSDLPSRTATINGVESYGLGIRSTKKQKVKFPSSDDPNPLQLIKTSLGDGQIEKLSVNLCSRMNSITLKYATD